MSQAACFLTSSVVLINCRIFLSRLANSLTICCYLAHDAHNSAVPAAAVAVRAAAITPLNLFCSFPFFQLLYSCAQARVFRQLAAASLRYQCACSGISGSRPLPPFTHGVLVTIRSGSCFQVLRQRSKRHTKFGLAQPSSRLRFIRVPQLTEQRRRHQQPVRHA